MIDKDKPNQKPTQKLTDEETSAIVGGFMPKPGGPGGIPGGALADAPPSCTATTDTGMMGCPG